MNAGKSGRRLMLELYTPKYEDLWFKQTMMADEETMSYNHTWGGTIPFQEEKWQNWYDHWMVNHENKRFYRYLKNEDGEFVGEIAYHFDDILKGNMVDVIIYSKFRGRGYGSRGLDILCDEAKKNGVEILFDDIAIDNPAIEMFLRHGFTEEARTEQVVLLKKVL